MSKKTRTDLLNLGMFLPENSFSATPIFSLELPYNLPTSNNQNKRKHKDVLVKEKLKNDVFKILKDKYGYDFPRIKEPILVHYIRTGAICDFDGLYSSAKWLMDCLVNLEIIPDDRPIQKKGGIIVKMYADQEVGVKNTKIYFYKVTS